ncbi:ABC transporter permease [Angelakisella massiliensis]|uniref:ABC transporter permease n=1 Tax=Angelakisella massiliensis TaxID=1871018 RepID=UPI0023A86DA2|nr:ABC transporter permease [Angelakisella massiliensis]
MTRTRKNYIYLLVLLPFLVVALLYEIVPLLMIVFNSFMPENAIGFTLEHYVDIFTKPLYQKAIWNSIRISLVSSLIGIFIAFLGAKAANSAGHKMQNAFLTVLNMTSNFAGVPLAFAYMILLGNSGVMIEFGKVYGIDALANFDLYTGTGLTMIYVYFQIPLSTLLLIPAFEGIRKEWMEASTLLGAGPTTFWTQIGVPVLLPSILGTISVLFANALAAYATAYALLMNNYALLPINISGMFVGDVTQRKEMGGALSVVMMLLMVAAIFINNYIAKKNRKVGR